MISPILTVDVEDWFHVCGDPEYADPSTWSTRVKRVHVGTERILEALDGTGSKATFFVLGWVARQSPSLVQRIVDAGHEVGCHGDLHRRVFEMTVDEFREDVRSARDTL
ncbi:MAG TPA: polysaccharide deacetylase family protein, partial [Thermoanaerobaculia bacterium]|nr:polysaccharide deacetylase family protein [Thermoanaerobaculia bacterium]